MGSRVWMLRMRREVGGITIDRSLTVGAAVDRIWASRFESEPRPLGSDISVRQSNQLPLAEDFFERCAVGRDIVGQTGGGAGGLHILEAVAGNQRHGAGAATASRM